MREESTVQRGPRLAVWLSADAGADARGLAWRESAQDRRVLWAASGVFAGAYAVGSVLQAAYVYSALVTQWSHVVIWRRAGANAVAVLALLLALDVWRQHHRRSFAGLAGGVVVAALALAGVRVVCQVQFGVYPGYQVETTLVELAAGCVIGLVSAGVGTVEMMARRVIRQQSRVNERLAVERALAVRALEDEETRVRRDVAEGLHASAQQHLVLLVAALDDITARLASRPVNHDEVEALRAVRTDLDRVREQDVRAVSRLLYPDQIQVGLLPAIRALLRRVPASITTRLDVDPQVRALDDPTRLGLDPAQRLLAARVVEEGVTNALRHANPTTVTVALNVDDAVLSIAVHDDGDGYDPTAMTRSGTRHLSDRLAAVGGELHLTASQGVGTSLVARLPLNHT